MRIILATAHPYLPQIAGGAQSNMHEMAVALTERGHDVTVVAGLTGAGLVGFFARIALKLGRPFYADNRLGYSVIRTWFPWDAIGPIVRQASPDVAIAQSGLPARIAAAFASENVPTVVHFHNVEGDDLEGMSANLGDAFIANSQFTAARASALFGVRARVIVPTFIRDKYLTDRHGTFITMINPHKKKGLEMMLAVVRRMPNHRFLFVKAWTLSNEEEQALAQNVKELPNLTLRARTNDMRSVYADTKILAVPSVWEEAWGRVATEAQFSGIPVVGSDRGGIAEAIGPGGIVLPTKASVDDWVDTLSKISMDQSQYAQLSDAALAHSKRSEIDLNEQMAAIEQVCAQAIHSHQATRYSA